jgi:hypothetical protein
VAAATQNRALNALVFLYKVLLERPLATSGVADLMPRDAAIGAPLGTSVPILGFCLARFPQEPWLVARRVTCLPLREVRVLNRHNFFARAGPIPAIAVNRLICAIASS